MLTFPNIDPIAISLGPLAIRWYGLSYVAGILYAWALLKYRSKQAHGLSLSEQALGDLMFYAMIGVFLGGRLGYVLFYKFSYYLAHPIEIFMVWQGGMAFHGGLIGVIVAMWFFAKQQNKTFFDIADFVAPVVPVGLFFGRIANFINGELWGRTTDVSWAMVFPNGGHLPRHPSQLYEAALEGIVLFLILWFYSSKPRASMKVSGLFLIGYGAFRFLIEFVREPDAHLGLVFLNALTMGHLLCIPMIVFGLLLFFRAKPN